MTKAAGGFSLAAAVTPAPRMADHAGTCTVVVASALWPEQRASAQLEVRPMAPWFFESPQDLSVRPGESVELRSLARGTEPISYQWLRNGELLEGADQPILILPSLTLEQGGFRFQLSVDPGRSYRVQTSWDLVNWRDWLGFVSTDGNLELDDPVPATNSTLFYRLISP